jgi:hypothetical protein
MKLNPVNLIHWFDRKAIEPVCKRASKMVNGEMNTDRLLVSIGVGSMLAKDALGCYLYVKQSLNNKEIPDDKRKFVAALDATNGVLMIGFQLLAAWLISGKKAQNWMFNKTFGKLFERANKKAYKGMLNLRAQEETKELAGRTFHKGVNELEKTMRSTFKTVTAMVGAAIIGKRVLVPFLATPLADKAKAIMSKNDPPENNEPGTVAAGQKPSIPASPVSSNLLDKYRPH